MTRFARAKGSKASNERVFSEPTPWVEMKNQMLSRKQEIEEEKKRREAEAKRNENYQKFLKERREENTSQTEWAEFPEEKEPNQNGLSKKSKVIKKQKNKILNKNFMKNASLALETVTNITDEIKSDKPGKILHRDLKQKLKNSHNEEDSEMKKRKKLKIIVENEKTDPDVESQESDEPRPKIKKQSKKNTSLQLNGIDAEAEGSNQISENYKADDAPTESSSKVEVSEPTIKKIKMKKKKSKIPCSELLDNKKIDSNIEKKEIDQTSENYDADDAPTESSSKVEVAEPTIKKIKMKKKKSKIPCSELLKDKKTDSNIEKKEIDQTSENDDADDAPTESSSKVKVAEPTIKKVKIKKKKSKAPNSGLIEDKKTDNNEGKKVKSIAGKQKRKEIDLDSLTEEEKKKVLKKLERRRRQVEKKKLKKQQNQEQSVKNTVENSNADSNQGESIPSKKKEFNKSTETFNKPKPWIKGLDKEKKFPKNQKMGTGDFKRRKDFQPNKIVLNGNEVQLEYVDGYPVKKEDAENLRKLKKEMISKGLPRSEINRTLKLERRKAEKALAREKKNVCFNCRKFGHNLSDCPLLSNKDELFDKVGAGICFKCGSTEHTSFACRVVHGESFKFATCFICKEQGHISRQCPDNARGLYPKGGSCRVCGDVTHLKKDCPRYQEQQRKEEAKFQVGSIFDGNPEDLGPRKDISKSTSRPRIVKF